MYLRKKDRKVIIEVYSGRSVIEKRLADAGFTFTTEDFLNNFWGTRFIIDQPRGKGTIAKMNFLADVCNQMERAKRYDVTITRDDGRIVAYIKRYESRDEARYEAEREFPTAKIVNVVPLLEAA